MQIKLNTSLLYFSALLFTKQASAIWYEGFASTVSCNGPSFGCSDNGGICCSLPNGYGYSVRFKNLPAGTQGQGYSGGGCSNYVFSVFGPGTKCWNGGGALSTHINWFHSPHGRRNNEAISIEARANNNGTCAPAYFKYEDAHGVERKIKVPAGDANAADTIAKLYTDKSFATLATYENF